METRQVFLDIQPFCVNVAKNLDLTSIQELDKFITKLLAKEKELSNDSISVLEDLKEYISFPLILLLKKQNSNSVRKDALLEASLRCLGKILPNIFSLEWQYFHDVFVILFVCLTSPENPQIVGNITEDCKLEALKNVMYLCKALSQDQRIKFYSDSFRPQLGHAVYICLKLVEKEKNKDIILTSLKTLEELGSKSYNDYDINYVNSLSYTWANFLPGIVMSTTRIATRKEIQGNKIIIGALECWQYFVYLVMRDEFLSSVVKNFAVSDSFLLLQKKLNINANGKKNTPELVNGAGTKISNSNEFENEENSSANKLKNIKLDSDWVKSTSERLFLLSKSICQSLVLHTHWNVRKTLSQFCHFILQNCRRSLDKCLVLYLETLITLKSDPVLDVSEDAENSLKALNLYTLTFEDDMKLKELLEERLFAIATRLPNVIKTQDDSNILVNIRQLNGFLEVMREKINEFVQISSHLHRLLHSLAILFTFDYSDNDILLEKITSEDSLELMCIKPSLGMSFRYFHSEAIFRCATECCSLIGQYTDIVLIVDHCLDIISEGSLRRNESILLLNLILQGQVNSNKSLSSQEKENIVSSILDLIINFQLLESPINSISVNNAKENDKENNLSVISVRSSKTCLSVDLSKQNIVLVSNTLKLIGSCASFMQEDFCLFLSKILCLVMEKAGENNVLIAHSALKCLESMASSCGHASISSLIEKSVHLFWFDLSQKLKKLPEYPSSPQVLRVVLKNHHKEMKFVEDLVEDVLESLDAFYAESSYPLLMVLLSYVDTNASLVKKAIMSKDDHSLIKESKVEILSIKAFMESLHEKHKTAQNDLEEIEKVKEESNDKLLNAENGFKNYFDSKSEQENEDQNDVKEEKKILPKNISLTVKILERCSYLLFTDDRKLQLVILDIIKHSFVILDDYEDEKLPCCHKIWKPLVVRLKSKDYIVFLKALEICLQMVHNSKDFLRKRFLKELFPSLTYFLDSQSSVSFNKTRHSGYFHTPSYKAQSHVLKGLPNLLKHVKISLLDAENLIQGILLYLDERQPAELCLLALDVLETIKELHPDLVWLALAFTKEPFRIKAYDPSLYNININGRKTSNISRSVFKLYEELSL